MYSSCTEPVASDDLSSPCTPVTTSGSMEMENDCLRLLARVAEVLTRTPRCCAFAVKVRSRRRGYKRGLLVT